MSQMILTAGLKVFNWFLLYVFTKAQIQYIPRKTKNGLVVELCSVIACVGPTPGIDRVYKLLTLAHI